MRKLFFTASLAAIAASSVPATAQDVASQNETTLAPIVVVTPLRRESALAGTTASVTVIDRATIEKSAASDIVSLLKSYPGVAFTGYGGLGSSTDLQLRGMSGKQTLILVNGVRTAAATLGQSTLANIPLDAIERVEIVRGPRSAAYGADAVGGVINIITQQGGPCPEGKSVCGSLSSGVSNPWGGFVSGDVRGEKNGFSFALGGSIMGTRGYNFTLPSNSSYEADDDGFRRGSVNFSLAKVFDWGRLYSEGLVSKGRNQYDDPWGSNESDMVTLTGKAGVRLNHSQDWFSTVEISQGFDEADNFREVVHDGYYVTRRTGVFAKTEMMFDAAGTENTVAFGGELYRENVDSISTWGSYEGARNLASVFGQYSMERGPLHFDSGIRYDDNQQFGGALTYNVGLAYDLTPDVTLRANHGTGFRAPTFSDLYYPNWSNPNLKPEESNSYEIGATWQAGPETRIDLSIYQNRLNNAIAYVAGIPQNTAKARISGIELSASHAVSERLTVNGGVELRDPRDVINDKYIQERERIKLNAGFSFDVTEAVSLSANALYGAGAYGDVANTRRLDPHVTLDVTALYKVDEKSTLKMAAENLFDEEYSTRDGYRAPGRTVTLSFTRQF